MSQAKIVEQMDAVVAQGNVVAAVERYFDVDAVTEDFDGTLTRNKSEMIEKMKAFTGGIQQVNRIHLHAQLVDGNASMSEFTFDFAMKDGSRVLWHEIIRRDWKDGLVVKEQYFKN